MRRKLAAGNWKMNGTGASLPELRALIAAKQTPACDVLICPPATLISRAVDIARGSAVMIGGQDCHRAETGAHTSDISAWMLADAGATHVILGHSERRQDYDEDDAAVRAKAEAAIAAGLVPIICVGERLDAREAGTTLEIVGDQLAGSVPGSAAHAPVVVAYEPVWAIGTGKVATLEQIVEVHDVLRAALIERFGDDVGDAIPLLYGGSVKAGNAAQIFEAANVDGALVGGASLKAEDFVPIIEALEAS